MKKEKNANQSNKINGEKNKKNPFCRIRANKNAVSDVLGSYTGTPVSYFPPEDIEDLFPVQDADDL